MKAAAEGDVRLALEQAEGTRVVLSGNPPLKGKRFAFADRDKVVALTKRVVPRVKVRSSLTDFRTGFFIRKGENNYDGSYQIPARLLPGPRK